MSTIQIKLLNNGCYYGDENVEFPVVVEAVQCDEESYDVRGDELIRVGFEPRAFDKDDTYSFHIGTECEVSIMSTDTYDFILAASPHTDYVTTSTADELYDAWRASGRDVHYHIVVNKCGDHDALMFRLVPRVASGVDGDEYTGDALIVAVALAGLCMVGYVAIGWFFS